MSNETISDINITAVDPIKKCSKQSIPTNFVMTKNCLKEHNLLTVPFDKGTGICLMESQAYENKLVDILKSKQFKQ